MNMSVTNRSRNRTVVRLAAITSFSCVRSVGEIDSETMNRAVNGKMNSRVSVIQGRPGRSTAR